MKYRKIIDDKRLLIEKMNRVVNGATRTVILLLVNISN